MISKEEYQKTMIEVERNQKIIDQYFVDKHQSFEKRMKENPIFTDDELRYSATIRCPCGHGLSYPKDCGMRHYWDCSAILKGIADKNVQHVDKLPFSLYNIKSESEHRGTTRPT